MVKNAYHPYLFGLGFLTRPANNYECLRDQPERESEWQRCTVREICDEHIPNDRWRPVVDDEYIDNWVSPDKFDLLCEPKYKIGLIGSMFFAGQVCTILVVPPLADFWIGRKPTFNGSALLLAIVLFGLLLSTNLYELYVLEFLNGCTFAGLIIVGLNYVVEYATPAYQRTITFYMLFTSPLFMVFMTFWYQMIDRGWFWLNLTLLVLVLVSSICFLIFVPESPKWWLNQQEFEKSREVLVYVAEFNGVED